MKRTHNRLWIAVFATLSVSAQCAPIQTLVFTETVKDVTIVNPSTNKSFPAKVGDTYTPPSVIKTGTDSRCELVAEDKTVTRIGSNSLFSLQANSRDINLERGSVLFHSPTGKGGGTIRSAGATASVLGTTLIVGANPSGGFKTMLLEGHGQIATPGDSPLTINAGQLSFAMPGQKPSKPLTFELSKQVSTSKLITGFSKPVASIAKIDAAIAKQQAKIAKGTLDNTGLEIGDKPDTAYKIDNTIIQVIQQEIQKPQEIASRDKLDPRYIAATAAALSLTNDTAPAKHLFLIDGSGANPENSFGLPTRLPGNIAGAGNHSVLFAESIDFDPDGPSQFIASSGGASKSLNHVALVAITDISIRRTIQFLGLADTNGAPLSPLLLSAGNTISISEGNAIRADVPLWEMYAGGSSFDAENNLSLKSQTNTSDTPVINWKGIAVSNNYAADSADSSAPFTGTIRLTAPSISITDSRIRADVIDIIGQGDVSIQRTASPVKLPIGFNSVEDLSFGTNIVRLKSTNKAVTISNVPISANTIQVTAGTDITLSGVAVTSDFLSPGDRLISVTAGRNLKIIDAELAAISTAATNPDQQALLIDLKANNDIEVGNEPAPDDNTARRINTKVNFKTVKTAQEVKITAGGNIALKGVSYKADKVTASAANLVTLNNIDLSQTQTVAIAANTIVLTDTQFKENASVKLNSRDGLSAPDPGHGTTVKNGMVNFVRNVFYGDTEVKFSTGGLPVTNADFHKAANSEGKTFSGIIIGKK